MESFFSVFQLSETRSFNRGQELKIVPQKQLQAAKRKKAFKAANLDFSVASISILCFVRQKWQYLWSLRGGRCPTGVCSVTVRKPWVPMKKTGLSYGDLLSS